MEVRERRTAVDYAQFMQNLVSRYYPTVDRLCLVQDNLNTHTPGAFYQVLSPEEAFQFSQIFELHYSLPDSFSPLNDDMESDKNW